MICRDTRTLIGRVAAFTTGGLMVAACSPSEAPLGPEGEAWQELAPATALVDEGPDGAYAPSFGLVGTPVSACRAHPFRAFDFWQGDYELLDQAGGASIGVDILRKDLRGCVLRESFTGTDAIRGRSISAYDRRTRTWRQTFVSALGTVFRLDGGPVDNAMVLVGSRLFPLGGGQTFPVVERATWRPLDDGNVSQIVELSIDGGATFAFVTNDLVHLPRPGIEPLDPLDPGACTAEAYGDLSFWLGEWRVLGPRGRLLGRSRVTADLNGCLIEEVFEGRFGYDSTSFFVYDATDGQWYRHLVDTRGVSVRLEGMFDAGVLELATERDGRTLRVSIRPGDDGLVEHVWEVDRPGSEFSVPALRITYER